jgi:cell wall-associated NlpC family hydrolase
VPAPRTTGRPALGPRETQALLQRLLTARPDLTAEQAARLVAAAAARSTGTPAGRRPGGKRPASRRSTPEKRTATTTAAEARTRSRWSTRLGVVAMSTVLVPAAAVLALPGADDPTRSGGPVDVTEVALSTQTSLLAQADRYRQLEQQITERRTDLAEARDVVATVETQIEAQQQILGASAADLYRSVPAQRYPLLGLSVHDAAATDAALYGQAVVERGDRDREGAAIRAERTALDLDEARRQVAEAEAGVADALEQADGVLRLVRDEVEELSPAVTGQIAGLGVLPVPGAQQERNETAMRRWQAYLARLSAAGIEPPPAARLADPAHLPAGFSPALDEYARPIPGVVWAVIGSSPVTVLPAETVAAVSTALSQLGKPFVPDGRGPDSYDCGGFTSASWLLAGHALPATPEEQWAGGAAVALTDLQTGDLVFSADGLDVGIYLGDGDVIGASAGTYQVGVRDLAAGASAVRVTLQGPSQPNEPLHAAGTTGPCGAPPPAPERAATPAWGGWANGQIPAEALCEIGVHKHALRCDAAASYRQLSTAFDAAFGSPLCITDSYRSLGAQVAAFYAKPALAAVPGTSNHGWALAVDLCGGINVAGSAQWTWMTQNASRFGFVQPTWAGPGGEKPEPWHWEYGYIS